jgi:hypothetical protein
VHDSGARQCTRRDDTHNAQHTLLLLRHRAHLVVTLRIGALVLMFSIDGSAKKLGARGIVLGQIQRRFAILRSSCNTTRRNAHSKTRQLWQRRTQRARPKGCGGKWAQPARSDGGGGRGRSAAHVVSCFLVCAELHQQRDAHDAAFVRGEVQRRVAPLRASTATQRSGGNRSRRRLCQRSAALRAHRSSWGGRDQHAAAATRSRGAEKTA